MLLCTQCDTPLVGENATICLTCADRFKERHAKAKARYVAECALREDRADRADELAYCFHELRHWTHLAARYEDRPNLHAAITRALLVMAAKIDAYGFRTALAEVPPICEPTKAAALEILCDIVDGRIKPMEVADRVNQTTDSFLWVLNIADTLYEDIMDASDKPYRQAAEDFWKIDELATSAIVCGHSKGGKQMKRDRHDFTPLRAALENLGDGLRCELDDEPVDKLATRLVPLLGVVGENLRAFKFEGTVLDSGFPTWRDLRESLGNADSSPEFARTLLSLSLGPELENVKFRLNELNDRGHDLAVMRSYILRFANDIEAAHATKWGRRGTESAKKRRRRGRRQESDPDHDRQIFEAWGQYKQHVPRAKYEEFGRDKGYTTEQVRLALNRHRKRAQE